MLQFFENIHLETNGQNLTEITNEISSFCKKMAIENGILNLSVLHTSASLVIQENASSDVLRDLEHFFDQLVPMDNSLYTHTIEGKDDMPAHIKSALTNSNLTLSIRDSRLILGTWQGIYLFEHRINKHTRTILAHIIGE